MKFRLVIKIYKKRIGRKLVNNFRFWLIEWLECYLFWWYVIYLEEVLCIIILVSFLYNVYSVFVIRDFFFMKRVDVD